MTTTSYFAKRGLRNAEVYGQGPYLEPGTYDLQIERVHLRSSAKDGRDFFIAEFQILDCTGVEGGKLQPGGRVSWLVDMSKPPADSNVKGFVAAVDPGVDPDSLELDELADALCSEGNPGRGIKLRAFAYHVPTRNGGTFTKVTWEPAVSGE